MSPPSAFSSISTQPAYGRGSSERGQPDIAVALVQEIAQREPGTRRLLHVVAERSHARHDRAAVVAAREAGGDARPHWRVGTIPLRLDAPSAPSRSRGRSFDTRSREYRDDGQGCDIAGTRRSA